MKVRHMLHSLLLIAVCSSTFLDPARSYADTRSEEEFIFVDDNLAVLRKNTDGGPARGINNELRRRILDTNTVAVLLRHRREDKSDSYEARLNAKSSVRFNETLDLSKHDYELLTEPQDGLKGVLKK